MRKFMLGHLPGSLLLVVPVMFLIACGGGGDGTDSGTTPSPTKSVVITGTVPGTVAIAYDHATGLEAARDVASGTPKTFTLSVAPGTYYLMFIESEGTPAQRTYAFRNVTGGNVFACKANTTLDLGVLVFNNYPGTAVPLVDPVSGNGNVTETLMPEAGFSPGDGKWIATRTFVRSTCSGHSPGTTVTEDVTIAHGFGIVAFTPAGTNETAGGVANVNTAILTGSHGALETIYLTMQSDGSLAGSFSKAGYGGACSEEGTISAVRETSPPAAATLTGLSINGPPSMSENGTAWYWATATWSNNSTSIVPAAWSVGSHSASITSGGMLYCPSGVDSDLTVRVTAIYSSGEITKTATKDVNIPNESTLPAPIPFPAHWVSATLHFEENVDPEGGYRSYLYRFDADSSFQRYGYVNPPETSASVSGTWSIDPSGKLLLAIPGRGPITVELLADLFLSLRVLVDDDAGTRYIAIWEKSGPGLQPFNGSLIHGTYVNQYGDKWIFNSDGTGSTTCDGGSAFTWAVDGGILKVRFPTGYAGWMVQRPSENTWTDYPVMEWAYVLYTPAGDFSCFYGGMRLTRQG